MGAFATKGDYISKSEHYYGSGRSTPFTLKCDGDSGNDHIVTIQGNAGGRVDRLIVGCHSGKPISGVGGTGSTPYGPFQSASGFSSASIRAGSSVDNLGFKSPTGQTFGPVGGGGGDTFPDFQCPSGQVLNAIRGYAGGSIDSIDFDCGAPWKDSTPPPAPTPVAPTPTPTPTPTNPTSPASPTPVVPTGYDDQPAQPNYYQQPQQQQPYYPPQPVASSESNTTLYVILAFVFLLFIIGAIIAAVVLSKKSAPGPFGPGMPPGVGYSARPPSF